MSLSPNIDGPIGTGAGIERVAEERLLRVIADQSRDMLIVVRPDGSIIYQSLHTERVLGYLGEHLIGQQAFHFLHPDDREAVRERLALVSADPARSGQFRIEFRVRHRDGSWRWFEALATNLLSDPTVGGILINARDITDRKQAELQLRCAEEALRQSELRYRTVAEFTPGFVQELELHPDGRVRATWASEGFDQIFGIAIDSLKGTDDWLRFVHPDDHEAVRERCRRLLAGEQTEGEVRIVDAHGAERWLLTINRPVGSLPGGGVTAIGVVYDITKRTLFEQRLKANESLLRAVTDSVPDRLLMLDADLRIQFANRRIMDLAPAELLGRNALDFVPEGARDAARAVYQRVMESREAQVFEFRNTVRGEIRWFENRVGPVIDDGRIVGLTVASSETTARRRGDEVLRTHAQILDTMREGVLVLDGARVIKVVNPAMARLAGYDPSELLGRAGRVLSRRTVTEYTAIESDLNRRIESEGFCEIEFECVRRDGSSFMAAAVITPIEIAGESHMLAMVEDITQRRSLEREIIEIANREQRRIGSDLHDGLGQELTGIALMLRGLSARIRKDGGPGATEAEEIVALVNKTIESTRQLARGLSPVTIERGGLPFALRSLAARATDMYGCHVRFGSKVWPQLTLEASPCNHLYRIAQEAITNAVRHGHATEVSIDLHANGEDVKLTVSDNGRGLPAGVDLAQGMGLRIMRYRANIVGGTVDIVPALAGGVLVTVSCRQPQSLEAQPRGAAS